jgi:hypothetical protein
VRTSFESISARTMTAAALEAATKMMSPEDME